MERSNERVKVLEFAFNEACRNERHHNYKETMYWLGQYKLLCTAMLKELTNV
jgi:hypothetical protein